MRWLINVLFQKVQLVSREIPKRQLTVLALKYSFLGFTVLFHWKCIAGKHNTVNATLR